MNRMIVTVFDSETQAVEGLSALKALHNDGDISLYATAVINKNEKGEASVKSASDTGPVGTSVGMLTGAFIGIIGGPAGMAIGASVGMLGGMFYDLDKSDIDANFVDEVAKLLHDGKTAVIADADEGWTAPVDKRMADLDGMVFRKNRAEVEDEQLTRESEAIDAEIKELKEDLKEASDDAKESINKQIDKLKDKSKAMKEHIDKRSKEIKDETDQKLAKLDAQMKDAKEKKKKKIEKRKAELRASYEATKAKMEAAGKKLSENIT